MTTEERVEVLEAKIARYDLWLRALILYAKTTPAGRRWLQIAGIKL